MDQGNVRFCAASRKHVLEGEALVQFENAPGDAASIMRAIPNDAFCSGEQSSACQVRLLVRVAAHALLPEPNDFHSATPGANQLVAAVSSPAATWVIEVAARAKASRCEPHGRALCGLVKEPLRDCPQAAVRDHVRLDAGHAFNRNDIARAFARFEQPAALASAA